MNQSNTSNAIEHIDAMYAEALRSFETDDLDALLNHWEDDGVYLWPAVPPAMGKQAIRAAYEGFFSNWTAKEIYKKHEIEVSGDLAYRRFSTDLTLTPKSAGPPTQLRLNGIHIYRRQPDGNWRFKVVIAINEP